MPEREKQAALQIKDSQSHSFLLFCIGVVILIKPDTISLIYISYTIVVPVLIRAICLFGNGDGTAISGSKGVLFQLIPKSVCVIF